MSSFSTCLDFEKCLLTIFVGLSQSIIPIILPNILQNKQQQWLTIIVHLIHYCSLIAGNFVFPLLFNNNNKR